MSIELGVTLGMVGIGAVIWFVRLEGRVNTQEALHGRLSADVTYIRERIDKALNGK